MMALRRLIPTLLIVVAVGGAYLSAALAEPGAAEDAGWRVVESHGGARYRPAEERYWWPAHTGTELPRGSIITTGSSGFLIVARPGESITIRPNSRVQLPSAATGGQVRQEAGYLRYRITRASDRRFTVQTPYLSLLVKGTVFEVTVGDRGTQVDVAEGRVQVDTSRGEPVELTHGQSARIAAGSGADLEVRTAPESPFAAAPSARGSITAAYPRDLDSRGPDHRTSETNDQAAVRSGPASPRDDDNRASAGGVETEVSQDRVRVDAPRRQVVERDPGQEAPLVGNPGARLAFRTGPESPPAIAPSPSRPTAALATHGDDSRGTDSGSRDADVQADDRSDRASPDGGDAGVEVTEDGLGIDSPGQQVAELTPSQNIPIARRPGADLEFGAPPEDSFVQVLPPARATAAPQSIDDGEPGTGSRPGDVAGEAADRNERVSAGGDRSGDAVAWAVLVALAAVLWWRLRRSRHRQSSAPGAARRWPWQRHVERSGGSAGPPSPATPSRSRGS